VVDVVVARDREAPLPQAAAVDDRCMVELVAHHQDIARGRQGREHGEVGCEPGREQEGGGGALPVGQLGLELVVDRSSADDQP
jgi:hypothetical protein